MDFQHDKSWQNLLTVINRKLTIRDGWSKIIDFHEQIISKPYWTALKKLEMESEQNKIKNWFEQITTTSPVPDSVVALWVGIIKIDNKIQEIPAIYIIGADTYQKDNIDWATVPSYIPDDRYFQSAVLLQIDQIIKADEDNYDFLDWLLPVAYCALTLDEIIRTKFIKKFFLPKKMFVSTGHDSGDFINLS